MTLCGRGVEGVAHTASAGACSWAELAEAVFDDAELDCLVRPCRTHEYPLPARRPAYSVLASERPDVPTLADWRAGLQRYLARRAALA